LKINTDIYKKQLAVLKGGKPSLLSGKRTHLQTIVTPRTMSESLRATPHWIDLERESLRTQIIGRLLLVISKKVLLMVNSDKNQLKLANSTGVKIIVKLFMYTTLLI